MWNCPEDSSQAEGIQNKYQLTWVWPSKQVVTKNPKMSHWDLQQTLATVDVTISTQA